jgi:hypothetical protein
VWLKLEHKKVSKEQSERKRERKEMEGDRSWKK